MVESASSCGVSPDFASLNIISDVSGGSFSAHTLNELHLDSGGDHSSTEYEALPELPSDPKRMKTVAMNVQRKYSNRRRYYDIRKRLNGAYKILDYSIGLTKKTKKKHLKNIIKLFKNGQGMFCSLLLLSV